MSSRIRFSTARQVFEAYEELVEDIDTAPTDEPPLDFLKNLVTREELIEALTFCAYVLPKREAVWWTVHSVRYLQKEHSAQDMRLLELAEDWVREPGSKVRSDLAREAESAERHAAATWVGYAVAWTGGSMSPIEDQHVPPPKALTPKACRAALVLAMSTVDRPRQNEAVGRVLKAGMRFAEGEPLVVD